MQWQEIDFNAAIWAIPAEKMKMSNDHLVPLCRQAIEILKEIEPLTGREPYVFPRQGKRGGHMAEDTLLKAMYKSGKDQGREYQGKMTIHGMRTTFKTIGLEVLGYQEPVIEAVLAHAPNDSNGTSYNRATYLQQRRVMLQAWADWLDGLRDVAVQKDNVVQFRQA